MSAHAADCDTNFKATGSFLSGEKFATFTELPNIHADGAFTAVQRYFAAEGWTIRHADRAAGVLTAWHSQSRPERPFPLTVTVEPSQGGAKLSLVFVTPGGAFSSTGAIQKEFCKVASVAQAAPAAPVAPAPASPAGQFARMPASAAVASASRGAPTSSPAGQLCLGRACLGMTLEEAASLPLVESTVEKFTVSSNGNCFTCGPAYGANSKGERIWYSVAGTADSKWIRQYAQTVKLVCVLGSPTAYMKASDGQRIILNFAPAIQDGKGMMELVTITRFLPDTMSESQWKAFEQQARERYGSAFYANANLFETPRGPYVTVRRNELAIYGVRQNGEDVNRMMKEQPGCSERTTLE
ncbi:hypothetical protein ACFPOU_07875 [Massilia jejuensis]|uniref:Lipoprotein n=1 Tax=Massilia jejuensis TaxID=648894 RepID=A0ABW0PHG5_9BURK